MKGLLTVLVVAALGAVAYFFVFEEAPKNKVDPRAGEGVTGTDQKSGKAEESAAEAGGSEDLVAKSVAKSEPKGESQEDFEKRRRAIWKDLRPMSERFVPDPDNCGPCPPASHGARAERVVRRFVDPRNGARTWVHSDGSWTQLSFGVGTWVDKETGSTRANEVVTSMVNEKKMAVAPDDLPLVNAPKQGGAK